ncbi:hypothetical protein Ptr902_03080 [Pyrenophora tritici-repentis]|nr:hypothetical protein Ptr902_03080 [Pyrenophora tritici-repentis]
MAQKNSCKLYSFQDGVCGCPIFWKKQESKPFIKSTKLSVIGDSVFTRTVNKGGGAKQRILRAQKGKKKKTMPSMIPGKGSAMMSRTQMKKKRKEANRLMHKKEVHEKEVHKKEVRVLVDYELPSGADRLDWDTDEVRRMAGEIA